MLKKSLMFCFSIAVACTFAHSSSVMDFKEKPVFCSATADSNTMVVSIAFRKWSWNETDTFLEGKVVTKQYFSGLDEEDFAIFCKSEELSKTSTLESCKDNVISTFSKSDGDSVEKALPAIKNICKRLMDGSMSVRKLIRFAE